MIRCALNDNEFSTLILAADPTKGEVVEAFFGPSGVWLDLEAPASQWLLPTLAGLRGVPLNDPEQAVTA